MDLIILGSGPAGIAAAVIAKRYGLTVSIITAPQKTIMANRPLQSVAPAVMDVLQDLGLLHVIPASAIAYYNGIHSRDNFMPVTASARGGETGVHLSRCLLTTHLLDAAKTMGIDVREESSLKTVIIDKDQVSLTHSNGKAYNATYLIDASGRSQLLGMKLGFTRKYYSPPLTTWSSVTTKIDNKVHASLKTCFTPTDTGWTWLAPHGKDACTWTRLAITQTVPMSPPPCLSAYDNTGNIFAANVRWRVFRPVAGNRVLLAGDAAGIIDPAAGQGILNACLSGKMAGQTVINIFNGAGKARFLLENYDDWYISRYEILTEELRSCYDAMGIIFSRKQDRK